MQLIEIKTKVKEYLSRSFHLHSIDDSFDIFESGGINSLFFIQLLVFIEKTFDIQLEEEDFDIRSLRTVNAISELLLNKLSEKA